MLAYDLLKKFGLFIAEGFFDAEECARLRAEMRERPAHYASVFKMDSYVYDEGVRRTRRADLSGETRAFVASRLESVMPGVAEHFRQTLSHFEEPQFLLYGVGDFFRAHRDSGSPEHSPAHVSHRRVSLVIQLNDQQDEPAPETFGGGALVFYGLGGDERLAKIGFPLPPKAGTFVAFDSTLLHEVTPVLHGERYTIVSWFR